MGEAETRAQPLTPTIHFTLAERIVSAVTSVTVCVLFDSYTWSPQNERYKVAGREREIVAALVFITLGVVVTFSRLQDDGAPMDSTLLPLSLEIIASSTGNDRG
jgi:hypothetical protein